MAEFNVTPKVLRTQAEELREANNTFKSLVENLASTEGKLNSMWEGEANTAFHTAFNNDKAQFENFYTVINQYVDAMTQIAQKYEQAEAANLSTATTRTY